MARAAASGGLPQLEHLALVCSDSRHVPLPSITAHELCLSADDVLLNDQIAELIPPQRLLRVLSEVLALAVMRNAVR